MLTVKIIAALLTVLFAVGAYKTHKTRFILDYDQDGQFADGAAAWAYDRKQDGLGWKFFAYSLGFLATGFIAIVF